MHTLRGRESPPAASDPALREWPRSAGDDGGNRTGATTAHMTTSRHAFPNLRPQQW
ncbi:hypothetical protein GCM10022402_16450 [Salinactinospora qingdaonensis]|uniref:Uncharacterized protein n=1 Tax=Salinactinospora qingdaonensis TaxID=702744 RepID=A0ABP7FDP4_9ACTN